MRYFELEAQDDIEQRLDSLERELESSLERENERYFRAHPIWDCDFFQSSHSKVEEV